MTALKISIPDRAVAAQIGDLPAAQFVGCGRLSLCQTRYHRHPLAHHRGTEHIDLFYSSVCCLGDWSEINLR